MHTSFAQVRYEMLLEKNWKFTKGDVSNAAEQQFNDAAWQTVTVPHDWAIYGPFGQDNDKQNVAITQNGEKAASVKSGRTGGLPFIGTGWYRTHFTVPQFGAGKKVSIIFDGAMSNAVVYVNGQKAGNWAYGYNSFHLDVTKLLLPGKENTLAVRLENQSESSRWYPGAGLYRNVHVVVTDDIHIPVWGTYVTTPVIENGFAKVNLKTQVEIPGNTFKPLVLVTEIRDNKGQVVSKASNNLTTLDQFQFSQDFGVDKPELWSPETPTLYTAVSKLYDGQELKDEYTTTFGIRTIKYEAVKGFSLNGQVRKFKGVCNHHDLGPLGAAINVSALRRQLEILKDMGCDAIRTSHNMPAPELMQLCDELGFMVMAESFDEWKTPKVKHGYSQYFSEWAEKDIVNLVHSNRNHPSVIMWSIGNEVPDQGAPGGNKLAKWLQDICHREDPTRPVTVGMDRIDDAITKNFAAVLDIAGFNYKPHRYAEANSKLPQGFIMGTETASTISSRGVYKFPVEKKQVTADADNQCSSYDLNYCYWSQVPDDEFVKQDDLQYVIGEFVWTGFDYLGEPTPYDEKWPSHSSYFGIVDLAGIPKDRFYLYRSRWNPTQQTLHILPHWTWPGREGQITPVFVYTNYPSAELFVNGKSAGKRTKDTTTNQSRYRLMWNDVVYQPGSLRVVAYDANGKAIAEETVTTAGKPHHVELVPEKKTIKADGKELAFFTAKVVDAKGNLCPDADNLLQFTVKGAGTYRAVANGDAANTELFHLPQMHVFKGMLTVIAQSTEEAGNLTMEVKAAGIKGASATVTTTK
ncbi:beta-galactosidase [Filimonas lacunae]|nr:beta-galactosidase [Filimonas lacunae]